MNSHIVKLPTNIKFILLNCLAISSLTLINIYPVDFSSFNSVHLAIIVAILYQATLVGFLVFGEKIPITKSTGILFLFIEFSILFFLSSIFVNSLSLVLLYLIPWLRWIIWSDGQYSWGVTAIFLLLIIHYQNGWTTLPTFTDLLYFLLTTIGLIFTSNLINNIKLQTANNIENLTNIKYNLAISKRVIEGLKSVSYSTKWETTLQNFSDNFKNIGGFNTSLVFIREEGTENLKLKIKPPIYTQNPPSDLKSHPQWEKLRQGNSVLLSENDNHHVPEWISQEYKQGIIVPLINGMNFFGLVYGLFESQDHIQKGAVEESKTFSFISSKYLWLSKTSSNRDSLNILLSDAGRNSLKDNNFIKLNDLSIDLNKETVKFKEKNIPVSFQEFTIIKILAKNINTYIEDTEIEQYAAKENSDILKSSVPVTIHRLRKKLGKIPGGSKLIKSKRGKGYTLSIN